MSLVDTAALAWLPVAVVLLVLGEFEGRAARAVRLALAPVGLALAAAFAWRVVQVFAPFVTGGG